MQFFFNLICIYQFNLLPLHRISESGKKTARKRTIFSRKGTKKI